MDRLTTERHLKQNKEIIRINQLQATRIASLEHEVTNLLSENIQLRTKVIQLSHQQDLSAEKAHLERKIREIHRLVRNIGSGNVLQSSPVAPMIRKSPKKSNLLNMSPEHSPERLSSNFISTRSKPRSLAAPSRVLHKNSDGLNGYGDVEQSPAHEVDRNRERREREKERETRRLSRRMSRGSDEFVGLTSDCMLNAGSTDPSSDQDAEHALRALASRSKERASRRRSRSTFESVPVCALSRESCSSPVKQLYLDDDKENAPSLCRSTAEIQLLHSSPVKSRVALSVLADPLPSANLHQTHETSIKPLKEVSEVKSEPASPALESTPFETLSADDDVQVKEESIGRSRRNKTINYAEPSLRAKMRRTESAPGDKRRKSSYRKPTTASEESRSSLSGGRNAIMLEEE